MLKLAQESVKMKMNVEMELLATTGKNLALNAKLRLTFICAI